MSQVKHTPGPWVIDDETRPADVCTVYHTSHPNGFVYVRGALGYWDADRDENMANAVLIAAAPELLAALKKLVGTPDDPNAGWRGSGGTDELFACEFCGQKHGDCTQIPHLPQCPVPSAHAAISKATGSVA